MSYRSLKRVLGENSLERKCLFLFGFWLLIVITGAFWWYSSQTDELVLTATRRTAAGLTTTVLFRTHLEKLDEEPYERLFRDLGVEPNSNEELYRDLGKDVAQEDYDWKFVRPNPRDSDPLTDEVESLALEKLSPS
ncbi:MAG TPA: hypothetical protein VMF30_06130, partial [Pirellulales bacterium]|nr:hypothetical protein [Pirellulales bacterium]